MANNYRAVLARPGALRLLSTALVGRLPQGMSSLAVLLLVRQATGSYAAAGAAVGAGALAAALCGPLLGRLIDRIGRRLVVGPVAAIQACVYVLLALAAPRASRRARADPGRALTGALVPPIAPVVRTLLRDLYEDQSVRETAYSMEAIAQETIWIVGPMFATIVITLASPRSRCAMLGVIGLSGTLLFLRSPLLDRPQTHEHAEAHRGSALASVDLRWLLAPVALMGFALARSRSGFRRLRCTRALAQLPGRCSRCGAWAAWRAGSATAPPAGARRSVPDTRSLMLLNCALTAPLLAVSSIPMAASAASLPVWPSHRRSPACTRWWAAS